MRFLAALASSHSQAHPGWQQRGALGRGGALLLLLCLLQLLPGCGIFGGDKKDEERSKTDRLTETELYERVQKMLDQENYELAVRNLQLLESRFPFGSYAEQAQLEIIYAYHQSGDDDAAVASAERFLRLHPTHPDADYAWYMKGLSNYSLQPGLLSRFYRSDAAAKDVEPARRSFSDFAQFLYRYPESPYAADARARMVHIKHVLARHELLVANYYIKRHAYVAAIKRAQTVLEQYPQTEATADALALLAYAFQRLGLDQQAQNNIALLKLNYPEHAMLDENGAFVFDKSFDPDKRSILNRLSYGLLDAPRSPRFDSRR
ncbi:MAG: outer membrane protein assembly factor BamD [Gammaproteobacteria bacterium]|nr:outer membrane protein assembly factor BamD [Gammaproteobacteria bacterium]NND39164.1 outer membrane protein assembly factor BamD [Pseudomonadales bacterium]MBT8150434.1 outer membrane protein assembly factor BamD [Gammaproteobacteria bacterium]NNL11512.1 outer membrane protein assembly factor BamD [Pseudomonadales bacterium]NNM11430.1 outer membrane protein assembly factor BamD [Pseudomonadales bacterium]